MTKYILLSIISFSLLISSCWKSSEQSTESKPAVGAAAAVQTTTHHGVGRVTILNPNVPSIEIDHEDIPGLMPAMEMEFRVKDKSLLNGLEVGNRVDFTVESGVNGLQISSIHKL